MEYNSLLGNSSLARSDETVDFEDETEEKGDFDANEEEEVEKNYTPVKLDKNPNETNHGDSDGLFPIAKCSALASLPTMTFEVVKKICKESGGYETPELNDKLYLHMHGFRKIENLDAYTGCKALWLDSNGIEVIENLSSLIELKSLYLSKNMLIRIDGLNSLKNLTQLDVSSNRLNDISNLIHCPLLRSINLAGNCLSSSLSLVPLKECKSLSILDLSNNKLPSGDQSILETIWSFSSLSNLSINGNDVTRTPQFRKKTIYHMPNLEFLDRIIEEIEKVGSKAFIEKGADAEKDAREAYRSAKVNERHSHYESYRVWQQEQEVVLASDSSNTAKCLITDMSEDEWRSYEIERKRAIDQEKSILNIPLSGNNFDEKSNSINQIEDNNKINSQKCNDDNIDEQETSNLNPESIDLNFDVITLLERANKDSDSDSDNPSYIGKGTVLGAEDFEDNDSPISPEEENEERRAHNIAESIHLYKKKLMEERNRKERHIKETKKSLQSLKNATPSNDTPVESKCNIPDIVSVEPEFSNSPNKRPKELYWTEIMDIELAQSIKKSNFNFDLISDQLRNLAQSDAFGPRAKNDYLMLTSEVCKARWAHLDAEKWSQVSTESAEQATVYKVLVHSESLKVGHGAQPSFQMMTSLSASKFPSYLTRPAKLPSVSEMEEKKPNKNRENEESDEDSDEEVEIFEIKNKYSIKNVS